MEIIRKIVIGNDPMKAMAYFIGQKAGLGNVSAIVLDERHYHKTSEKNYLIYIESEDGSNLLWKRVEGMPVIIENDCNF
jgi:hypothetical protein